MKGKIKNIVYLLIFGIIFSNIFLGYSFAGNQCPTCSATPVGMQTYINFEVELLGLLQNMSAIQETFGTNKKSGLFTSKNLGLTRAFLKGTLEKIQNDLDSEIKAARALAISSVLLEKMSLSQVFSDGPMSIYILFKSEAFVRDYKILQEIDMSVNDVIWDMGVEGIRNDRISSSIGTNIANLQQKYSRAYGGSTPIFEKIIISGDVRYRQLSSFILRLNAVMKNVLLRVRDEDELNSSISDFENFYSKGNIVVKFDRDYIDSIAKDYRCATVFTCSSSTADSIKNLADWRGFANSWGQFKQTIKNANKDLKEAIQSSRPASSDKIDVARTGGLTDKQIQLLRVVYGIDSKDLTTSQEETLKRNLEERKKEFNPFSDVVRRKKDKSQSTADTTDKSNSRIKNNGNNQQRVYLNSLTEEQRQELSGQLLWQQMLGIPEKTQLLVDTMQETVDSIMLEKINDKQWVLAGLDSDTHYFVEIGAYIHSIIDDEIGTKSTEGLIQNLGEACVYQCSNKGTNNCYAD